MQKPPFLLENLKIFIFYFSTSKNNNTAQHSTTTHKDDRNRTKLQGTPHQQSDLQQTSEPNLRDKQLLAWIIR